MQTSIKRNADSTVEIEIELQPAELQPYLERAAKKLSEKNPIEGFRPGKAVFEIVKQKFGEMSLYEHALSLAIDGTIPEILVKEKLRVVGWPEISVKKIAPGNPIEFTLKSAILPDFTLPDFESITKDVLKSKRAVAVEDKEIEYTLQWIRNSRGKEVPAERPASKGDPVEIDFRATADGQVLERGSSQNHPLVIGEGKFVAGFEDQLIGMSQGEEKSFNLVMPSDYHEPTLAGKVVDFRAKMNDVKERQLPELNDEFAKSVGNFPSLDALRANIRDGIRQEKEHRERERIRIAIADGLAAKTEAAIPQALIESELEKMILELRERIEEMNMKFEDYLTHLKKTETDLRKEWESDAKRRVKIALILGSIAEAKSIVPSEAEVEIEANRVLTKYPTPEDAAKALDSKALRTYARSAAKNEKVFQYLESLGEK